MMHNSTNTPRNSPRVQLRTLGQLSLSVDDVVVDIGLRPLLLLTYLSWARPRAVARDTLAQLLWPDVPLRNARHSLSQALHALRTDTAHVQVEATPERVQLTSALSWDVDVMMHAVASGNLLRATRMLRGGFLSSVDAQLSDALDDWRSAVTARLHREFVRHLVSWFEAAAFAARWDESRAVAEAVHRELHIELDELELSAQHRGVLRGEADPPRGHVWAGPLVGRTTELHTLRAALDRAGAGVLTFAGVVGEPGIGKTHLCHSFTHGAELLGASVMRGKCYDTGGGNPLRVLTEMLQAQADRGTLAQLGEARRAALHHLLDGSHEIASSADAVGNVLDRQQFLFSALAAWLDVLAADRTLVLFIDDVQWTDSSTIEFLQYLKRRGGKTRLLLVLAARDETAGNARLHELDVAATSLISLQPLQPADLHQFAPAVNARVKSRQAVGNELRRRTAGHPFMLAEIARAIADHHDGHWSPETVRQASRNSLPDYVAIDRSALSADARDLLTVIAVLAKPVRHEIVRRVAGLGKAAFLRAFRELLHAGAVVERPSGLECRHDLFREAAYRNATRTERQLLHHRCAEVLSRRGASRADLVHHFLRARLRKRAYLTALRGARASIAAGAHSEAEQFLKAAARAARHVAKRNVLLLRRARLAQEAGRLTHAAALYKRLLAIPAWPEHVQIDLQIRLLDCRVMIGNTPSDAVQQAVALADRATGKRNVANHLAALRCALRHQTTHFQAHTASAVADRIIAFAETVPGTTYAAHAFRYAAMTRLQENRLDEAEQLSARALAALPPDADVDTKAWTLLFSSAIDIGIGNLKRALATIHAGLQIPNIERWHRAHGNFLSNIAVVAMDMEQWDVAEQYTQEALRLAYEGEAVVDRLGAECNCAVLGVERQNFVMAERHARNALAILPNFENAHIEALINAILGLCALARGAFDEARSRRDIVLSKDGQSTGQDFVTIEQFLARMAAIENQSAASIERLERLIASPAYMMFTSRLGLTVELARLLMKDDPRRAQSLLQEVRSKAQRIGATALLNAAEQLLARMKTAAR